MKTAARLLARMLSEDVPVRLRLYSVAQATGAETAYPSLDDLSGALAYFERPDENQILRALFERGAAAPIRTVAAPVIADPPDIGADEFEQFSRTRTRLRLIVGAAVTAGCVLVGWLGASAGDYGRLGMLRHSPAKMRRALPARHPRRDRDRVPHGIAAPPHHTELLAQPPHDRSSRVQPRRNNRPPG